MLGPFLVDMSQQGATLQEGRRGAALQEGLGKEEGRKHMNILSLSVKVSAFHFF